MNDCVHNYSALLTLCLVVISLKSAITKCKRLQFLT